MDIIRSIQEWHLEGRSVPDARDASMDRGRGNNAVGFSGVEGDTGAGGEEGSSLEGIKEEEEEGEGEAKKTNGTS